MLMAEDGGFEPSGLFCPADIESTAIANLATLRHSILLARISRVPCPERDPFPSPPGNLSPSTGRESADSMGWKYHHNFTVLDLSLTAILLGLCNI